MRKLVILIPIALLAIVVFSLWDKYKGFYYANKASKQNIVQLINESNQTPKPNESPKPAENDTKLPLNIPDGYALSVYASGLNDPRDLVLDPNGIVLVSEPAAGRVVALEGEKKTEVAGGLNKPHGLVFDADKLFVGETDKLEVFDYSPDIHKAANGRKILDLPGGGEHFTRSLLIKDNKLYVSIGSDCNACQEKDPRRASIWWSNLDGSNFKLYASGLRNAVFMAVNPVTNEIWATNMGRDYLGDNVPPDTVNIIKSGANYGWPWCYGNKITDGETNPGNSKYDCSQMESPKIEIQAHSAPLGLAFMGSDLLIAYHGSWNRTVPTGYKIVKYSNGKLEDFITGWLTPSGDVLGRPVDILVNNNDVYISDDKAGVIYLLRPS